MCKKVLESRLPNGEVTKRFPSVNQAMNQLNDSLVKLLRQDLSEGVRLELQYIFDHDFHYVSTAIKRVSNKQKSLVSNMSKILRSTSISEFSHYQWKDKS